MAHIHDVIDANLPFEIDPITRKVRIHTIDESKSKIYITQYDHNSERITFRIPRTVDGHDMLTCNSVRVHFINVSADRRSSATGVYDVDDLHIDPRDPEVVTGTWLVSRNATQLAGILTFVICFVCSSDGGEDYAWNSAMCSDIVVFDGIHNTDIAAEEYIDLLEQWKKIIVDLAVAGAENAQLKAESAQLAAETARAEAEQAKTDAETSAGNALISEQNAKNSEEKAVQSEVNAAQSEANVENIGNEARNAANAAKLSEQNAATSETNARASEVEADLFAERAETSARNANQSESNARVSEQNAATYETGARDARIGALAAEQNAKQSENNAKTSETNAKASEEIVRKSANAAAQSETNAGLSEDNAKRSEVNAELSATAAAESAESAAISEQNSKSSETNAANSKTAAEDAETKATASANAASESERKTAQYQSDVSVLATEAANAANRAETAATNAATSAKQALSVSESIPKPTPEVAGKALIANATGTGFEFGEAPSSGGGQSDWNANEGESGHILNRTHYTENVDGVEVVHKLAGKYLPDSVPRIDSGGTVVVLPETTFTPDPDMGGQSPIMTPVEIVGVGATLTVVYNGVTYTCTAEDFSGMATGAVAFGDADMFTTGAPSGKYPFVGALLPPEVGAGMGFYGMIMPLDGASSITLSIHMVAETLHKLDSRLLPDDIVKAILIVKYADFNTLTTNYTFADISAALLSGKAVFFAEENETVPLVGTATDRQMAEFGNIYFRDSTLSYSRIVVVDNTVTVRKRGTPVTLT